MARINRFVTALVAMALSAAYLRFRQEKRKTLSHLEEGSQIVRTPFGLIEYALAGEGRPILILHGAGGGYAQGLLFQHICDPRQYLTVAISRPGYHRTPLETGRTPKTQSDACAALLDHLHIDNAVVVGMSAGGLSAIQFALHHPNRCQALILLSAATPAIQDIHASPWMLSLLHFMMSSDFVMWLMLKMSSQSLIGTMTGKLEFHKQADAGKKDIIAAIVQGLFPTSLWRDGTINDIEQVPHVSVESLKQITIPTLVIHGTEDRLVPYAVAQFSAKNIPHAKFLTIEGGSHLIIGTHDEIIGTAITDFVTRH